MKKALAILLVYSILMTLLVVSPFTASADEKSVAETGATSGTTGDCTWEFNNGVLTISGNGKMEDYIDWEYYLEERPWHNYDITKVVIKSGVTYVGDYTFSYFEKLTSVTIPDSVTNISRSAFYGTAWYDNQPDGLVYAGKVAYKMKGDCPAKVVIKDGTLGIGDAAFYGCSSLKSITIPDSVTSIGGAAFANCTSLTSITIPDSVTSIGDLAFSGCKNLTSINIPDSVTRIGNLAFTGCSSLITARINQVAVNAFSNIFYSTETGEELYYYEDKYGMSIGINIKPYVKNVIISDSVTSIDRNAFSECYSMNTIIIPDSVTSIGNSAFSGCSSLTSVTIPDSVTSIGNSAFSGCENLTSIDIPDSVTSISYKAFYGCKSLSDLSIGNSVETIASYAFYGCKELMSVTIPNSVTSIEEYAFYGCESLTKVVIGNSVETIASYAFYGCKSLSDLSIGNSVETIASNSFYGCTGLKSVTIPDSVEAIASSAFYGCSSLTKATIPASVTDIYDKAFGYYTREGFGESKVKGFTVYGYEFSEAERYANDNDFTFIALVDDPSDPTRSTDRDIFGDIDGDGEITVIDSSFLQRYATRLYTPYPIGRSMK